MVRANPRVLEGVSSDDNDSVFDIVGFLLLKIKIIIHGFKLFIYCDRSNSYFVILGTKLRQFTALNHSHGFKDEDSGEFPWLVSRYCSCLLQKQILTTFMDNRNKTLQQRG